MEDVSRDNHCRLWHWCLIIFVLLLVQSNLYAATQGSVGNSSSRGNISITLEIPQLTRISAELDQLPLSEYAQLCLHVSDINNPKDVNFITIAGLKGDIPADYNIGKSDYQLSSQMIKSNGLSSTRCNFQTSINNTKNTNGGKALLLMMIAE
ncbi:MAG: hypothetical protein AB8B89_00320 [Gammaproteobacteria bacterium]